MKREKSKLLILFLATMALNVHAQRYLSMNEALTSAHENNASSQISDLEERIAYANYRQTDAVFLPQIELGYSAVSTNNPLNAFGFLLNQASVTAADFDPTKLNDPGSVENYNAKAEMRLPLLNLDMIYARKGAKSQREVYLYKSARTKQYVDFEVKKMYNQLQFSYKAKEILEQSLADVKAIHRTSENFYAQGLIQESDVLNALVQVNTIEAALAKAKSNIHNASEGLAVLIGTKEEGVVYLTDSLDMPRQEIIEKQPLSLGRADIMALGKAVEAAGMMQKSAVMSFLPRINAFGTYQLNDSKAFGFDANSYMAGISLSWTIFSGNRNRSKYKSYQYQKIKLEKEKELHIQQSNLELNKTYRELSDFQVEIQKHTTSVEQATEALRILNNRYKEGLSNTTDLLAAQAQLSQQQLLRSQAVMSYNVTKAYIEFLSEK
ncbi:MAG: TolC family protein [Massilibacteroides sp.]|nr:TolC family protein [Massilibacteroides sp.]MDD4115912.1 TolC family protein [Massilibacteroides sp.]